jgi:hypothetical protein
MATRNNSKGGQGSSKSRSKGGSTSGSSGSGSSGAGSSSSRGRGRNSSKGSSSGSKTDPRRTSPGKGQGRGTSRQAKGQSQQSGARSGPFSAGRGGGISRVAQSIKQHPITSAAIGAGFGLLALEGVRRVIAASRSSRRHGDAGDQDEDQAYEDPGAEGEEAPEDADEGGDEEDDPTATLRERAAAIGDHARSGLSGVRSIVRKGASHLGRAAQRGYSRGRESGLESWQRHPLMLCAAALAAGTTIGMMLPVTSPERRLLGKRSERITGRMRQVGTKLIDQSKRALREAADTTVKEADREGLTPGQLGRKVKRIASHIRDAIGDAIE